MRKSKFSHFPIVFSQSFALLFPRECKRLNPLIRVMRDRVPESPPQLAARSVVRSHRTTDKGAEMAVRETEFRDRTCTAIGSLTRLLNLSAQMARPGNLDGIFWSQKISPTQRFSRSGLPGGFGKLLATVSVTVEHSLIPGAQRQSFAPSPCRAVSSNIIGIPTIIILHGGVPTVNVT